MGVPEGRQRTTTTSAKKRRARTPVGRVKAPKFQGPHWGWGMGDGGWGMGDGEGGMGSSERDAEVRVKHRFAVRM